jgi:hypothetical protein
MRADLKECKQAFEDYKKGSDEIEIYFWTAMGMSCAGQGYEIYKNNKLLVQFDDVFYTNETNGFWFQESRFRKELTKYMNNSEFRYVEKPYIKRSS